MNRTFTALSLALLLAMPQVRADAEAGWELKKDSAGVQIYSRPYDGSSINQIRGVSRVHGTVESIVSLLQDMTFWPELNKIFSQARVYQQLSPSESLVYLRMDMPWPVSDRDVLNRRRVSRDCETGVVTIEDVATRDVLPVDADFVRIVDSTQLWTLTPEDDGRVLVEWVTHTDPNGPIPSSVINFLSTSAPFDSLSKLRLTIEQSGVGAEALGIKQSQGANGVGMDCDS